MNPAPPIVALGELLWDLLPTGRRAGGAPFNFAFHCHQLGHPAVIVSRVGADDLGQELRAEVCRLGMSDEFIQTDPEHPTGTVTVELDAKGQPTYAITDDVAWDYVEFNPQLDGLCQSARAICFGTLAQRAAASRATFQRLVRRAHPRTATICDLNLRPPFFTSEIIDQSVHMTDWLKLNADELRTMCARPGWESVAELVPVQAGRVIGMLTAAYQLGLICLTRGAAGCIIQSRGEEVNMPGVPVPVADTVGAGDAFTAALLTQHLEGKPLAEAGRFANAYAAVVASKPGGTPPVTRAEVERLL